MVRKWIALVVILTLVFSTAYALFGESLKESFTGTSDRGLYMPAFFTDRKNNVYMVRRQDEDNYLVKMDAYGKELFVRRIEKTSPQYGEYIREIYVDQGGGIYLSKVQTGKADSRIYSVSLQFFRDDATSIGEIFRQSVNTVLGIRQNGIVDICEDKSLVYFAVKTGNSIEVHSIHKTDPKNIQIIREYAVEDADSITDIQILPPGHLLTAHKNGDLFKISLEGKIEHFKFPELKAAIIDGMWLGTEENVYIRDMSSRDLLKLNLSHASLQRVVSAKDQINEKLTFSQMTNLHIEQTGNMVGEVRNTGRARIAVGGFTYMKEIVLDNTEKDVSAKSWIYLLGVLVGALIVSLLIWDGYCNILKMKISILVKQGVLVISSILAMLYILISMIIKPGLTELFRVEYRERALTAARTVVERIDGNVVKAALSSSGSDNESIQKLGTIIGSIDNSGFDDPYMEYIKLEVYGKAGGQNVVVISEDGYQAGYPVEDFKFKNGINQGLDSVYQSGNIAAFEVEEPTGKWFYVFLPVKNEESEITGVMASGVSMGKMQRKTGELIDKISRFLYAAGSVIALLIIASIFLLVYWLRVLKRGVEQVAEGKYSTEIHIRSGDEIETLAASFNQMFRYIKTHTEKLNMLNRSYYRFVPESFIRMLGEDSIEKVGKGKHIKKEMAIMYMKVGNFTDATMSMNTEGIFSFINEVYEYLSPVVQEYDGTIYSFMDAGFTAVFPGNTVQAVTAALRIREVLNQLNDNRNNENKKPVDIRIALHRGDVMLGVVGDDSRMTAAAISENIHVAQRVEAICSFSDIYVVCTKQVMDAVDSSVIRHRCIGRIKDILGEYDIYDIFDGDEYALMKSKEYSLKDFNEGLRAFHSGRFDEARKIFMEIVKKFPEDGTARNYLYLSDKYANDKAGAEGQRLFYAKC